MGAEFLELNVEEDGEGAGGYAKKMSPAFIAAEMALFAAQAKDVDIIITTALIPGKAGAGADHRRDGEPMNQGSVIVDLAAEAGGNCALTEPGEVVDQHGVTIIGYIDLPSRLAPTASQLFGNNLTHLLADMGGAKSFHLDLDDEVVRGALVLHDGELLWPPPKRRRCTCRPWRRPRASRRRAPAPPKAASQTSAAQCGRLAARGGRALGLWARSRPRRSSRTSPCSCWRASSAGRSCGTSLRRCTRR